MPREAEPRMVGRRGGVKGLAVVERQAPAENAPQPGRAPPSSGHRGHPPRAQLVRAERGNPVAVRLLGVGKPTVRKAQFLGGNRMIEKQMPAAETQQETGTRWSAPPPVVPHNWPDTGPGARPERGLTRIRWACEAMMTNDTEPTDKLGAIEANGPEDDIFLTGVRLTGAASKMT